ncbi:hypothetical protein SKAU_G00079000 [Synaphobranchus kaupii]|uniref:Uncharacterized protein n=1 Tax=Synaphobranchus kaupii TaxID=118154 RepID=A0A9Q1FUL0_SYNKA|nr:hypothetical protein SKAU_G00079000 [Synaphobranchus kaupii]
MMTLIRDKGGTGIGQRLGQVASATTGSSRLAWRDKRPYQDTPTRTNNGSSAAPSFSDGTPPCSWTCAGMPLHALALPCVIHADSQTLADDF